MTAEAAAGRDIGEIARLDAHIPRARLDACIRNGFVYVLRDGAAPVAGVLRYSLFWQTIPFLEHLYIDAAYRGRGFGRGMMAYWEGAMRQKGYAHVMLSTQADETAQFFYEKLGYRRTGSFLPPGQEALELMYVKKL